MQGLPKHFEYIIKCCLKKNRSASRPSEHPTQGEKCQNALGGIIVGCKDSYCLFTEIRSLLYSGCLPAGVDLSRGSD